MKDHINLFETKVSELKLSVKNFIDQDFPHTIESMGLGLISRFSNKLITWRRIRDIDPTCEVFPTEKDGQVFNWMNDVIQGQLGDCYFLSALTALAEFPERIAKRIKSYDLDLGIIEVSIYLRGKETLILVDDYFPCVDDNGVLSLAFSGINHSTHIIWPLILEKVWAKLNKSYLNIETGNVMNAFDILSPSPTEPLFHGGIISSSKEYESYYNKIKEADIKEFIICCDLSNNLDFDDSKMQKAGLVNNHAYSVISVHEIDVEEDYKIRLLKLRNPWGGMEWSGDWGWNCKKWKTDMKKQVGFTKEARDDGIFMISFKDYIKFFSCSYINKFHSEYNYISQEFERNENSNYICAEFEYPGRAYFILSQDNSKILEKSDFKFNPYTTMVVMRLINNEVKTEDSDDDDDNEEHHHEFKEVDIQLKDLNVELVGEIGARDDRLFVEAMVEPGRYLIIVAFPVQPDNRVGSFNIKPSSSNRIKVEGEIDAKTFNIGVYTKSAHINFFQFSTDIFRDNLQYILFQSFLRSSLYFSLQYGKEVDAMKKTKQHLIHFFIREGEISSFRYTSPFESISGRGLIVYKNDSEAIMKETFHFSALENINIFPLFNRNLLELFEKYNPLFKLREENIQKISNTFEYELLNELKRLEQEKFTSVPFSTLLTPATNSIKTELNVENPLSLEICTPPNSYSVVILKKNEEEAYMSYTSDIEFIYPFSASLFRQTPTAKDKVRPLMHKNRQINSYEKITHYSNGIIIKYEHFADGLELNVLIRNKKLENLKLDDSYLSLLDNKVIVLKHTEAEVEFSLKPDQIFFINYTKISGSDNFDLDFEVEYILKKIELEEIE